MIQLVIGGPDSGKSLRAEELAASLQAERVYYIATMRVLDDAGRERIKKHRAQRAGRGFVTLEIETEVDRALAMMEEPEKCACLLECVSNLVGNTLYDTTGRITEITDEALIERVLSEVKRLAAGVHDAVIVSSEYASDDADDAETARYIRLLHEVNMRLKGMYPS